MQPNEQPQSVITNVKTNHHSRITYVITCAVLIILAGIASYAVYQWQHNKVLQLQHQGSTGQTVTSPQSSNQTKAAANYSLNAGASYPLSLPKKKVVTTLYLPNGNSILQIGVNTKSQAELASYYTESFNDIIANWIFSAGGSASDPSDSLRSNENIIITALNNWMETSDPADVSYGSDGPDTIGPMTAAQKATFVRDLKNKSAVCAKDTTKGFMTDDKVYSVCVNVLPPHAEGAGWIMDLSGYANIQGTNTYLRGYIDLPNKGHEAAQATFIKALKKLTTVVQDNDI